MMVVGLTGGIGSGKSTVLKMFQKLGVTCYMADFEAKKIMQNSPKIKKQIIKLLGKNSYENEKLNKSYIANIIFKDQKKLKKLNAIVHPEVNRHFKKKSKKQNTPYVVYESAVLFESKISHLCDAVILVVAPTNVCITRVLARDNISLEEIKDRMNNQFSDSKKKQKSDYIIQNTDLSKTEKEVLKLHRLFVKPNK